MQKCSPKNTCEEVPYHISNQYGNRKLVESYTNGQGHSVGRKNQEENKRRKPLRPHMAIFKVLIQTAFFKPLNCIGICIA